MDQSALLRIALLAMSLAVIGFAILQSLTQRTAVTPGGQALLIFLSLYAVLKLDELLIITGFYMGMPYIAGMLAPLRMLIAPAFFIYVRAMTSPKEPVFRRSDLWAVSGPAGFALLMSWYFVLPDATKQDLLSLDFSDPALRDLAFTMCRILFAWFFIFSAIYVVFSLQSLRRHVRDVKSRFSNIKHRTLNWLRIASLILLGMLVWFAAGELWGFAGTRPVWFSDVTAFAELAAVGVFCVFAFAQPALPPHDSEKQASPRWSLSDSDLTRIGAALQSCMVTRKLYTKNDLSLRDLASAVKRSEDHVTQTLSQHLGTNFYAFVNAHRVEEAQRLLRETDLPVLDVGMEAGFNTKSTFNTSFKRITGQTPSAYRDAPRRDDGSESMSKRYDSGELDEPSCPTR